jgi:DNA-binding MarR family transcriptional regulator
MISETCMISEDFQTVEAALDAFRRLMASLHAAGAQRGGDPWFTCPMTMPQLRALSLIVAANRGLSSRQLAASLGVGASAVTPLVDRLVDHGYVLRHEDPHDRRISRLTATASGSAMLEHLVAGKGDVLREAFAHLTPEQLQQVTAAFDLLRGAMTPSPLPSSEGALQGTRS